jgi:hypothetical protein
MIALGGRSGIVELHDEEECEYWDKDEADRKHR